MLANKSANTSATSNIAVIKDGEETSVIVMTLAGQLKTDGRYTISRSIENPELYAANKEQMDADEKEFEAMLLSKVE